MEFNEQDVTQFMETIWDSILHLPLVSAAPRDWSSSPCMVAIVRISGAWQGEAILACRPTFAERAASIMFSTDVKSLTDIDVTDALAELANIVGGQVKSLVVGPSKLSLPCLDDVKHFGVPHGQELMRMSFECEGEPLLITINNASDAGLRAA